MSNAAIVRVRILADTTAQANNMLGPSPYKVFHLNAPQENSPRPYIIYRRVRGSSPHHMLGTGGIDLFNVELTGYCDSANDMETLSEICRNMLDGYRGSVTVDSTSYDVRHIRVVDASTEVIYPDTARGLPIYVFSKDLEIATFQSIPTY